MKYTKEEVMQYVAGEDVKFIRMAFCDVFGVQKNVSIMPGELERAFAGGIAVDAAAVPGFGTEGRSDLFLHPDPATLCVLPWRPDHGRVVRMFCNVTHPGGDPLEADTRRILADAVNDAQAAGISFFFGTEMEFYLFRRDERGEPTGEPLDRAGYMDIAPEDKGENVRREICLTLERMGIRPERSHHEEGPGQNEIDFRFADPLCAADNAVTFRAVVNTIAAQSGLYADFSAKPMENMPGNGMHVNFSARRGQEDVTCAVMAGILAHIREMCAFLNPTEGSYRRLGSDRAPRFVTWSEEDRRRLIRVPACAPGELRRAELRSPDPLCNPYLAFALLIRAGLCGVLEHIPLPPPTREEDGVTPDALPATHDEAKTIAATSAFIARTFPLSLIRAYTR